jgi:hypothetical protein
VTNKSDIDVATMRGRGHTRATFGAALVAISLAGCASVVSGRHADVTFRSNVPYAHVVVRDKRGHEVTTTQSGSTVALKRKDGLILPAKYTATFAAPGYQPAVAPITSTVNPWVLGNFVFGGVVGLVVDNATGAAWMPTNSTVFQELTPLYPAASSQPQVATQGPEASVTPASGAAAIEIAMPPVGAHSPARY